LLHAPQGVLSDAWVVPLSELGQDDKQVHCRTHLGHILKDGDTALGFNFRSANLNDRNFDLMKPSSIPDVVSLQISGAFHWGGVHAPNFFFHAKFNFS
jgi:nonsense-mediated mRNA decay protein 3